MDWQAGWPGISLLSLWKGGTVTDLKPKADLLEHPNTQQAEQSIQGSCLLPLPRTSAVQVKGAAPLHRFTRLGAAQ